MEPTEGQRDKEADAVSPVIGVILMVAITVILAAVIGTFVLGLGEDVGSTSSAGVQVSEEPGFQVTFTIVDAGNLDGATVVGPDGNRSAKATDTVQSGVKVIIQDGGFDTNNTQNVTLPPSLGGGEVDLVGNEECLIRHGEQTVREFPVRGADIGCSAKRLQQVANTNLGANLDIAGSEINYEADAEYKLIGEVDGDENVIQSLETSED